MTRITRTIAAAVLILAALAGLLVGYQRPMEQRPIPNYPTITCPPCPEH